jgi:hypothetical protein
MQPKALSVEPLMIFGTLFLAFVLVPILCVLNWRLGAKARVLGTAPVLILLAWICFSVGQMVGRSKAWYHWRFEYYLPLAELRLYVSDLVEQDRKDALAQVAKRFSREKVESYGREGLFEKSDFRKFVEEVTRQP